MVLGRDIAGVFGRAAPSYGCVGQDVFGFFGRRLVAMIGRPLGPAVLEFHVGDVVVEHFGLRWDDVDEWWDSGWSHGYREVLEALSPSALQEYRRRSDERLRGEPVRGRLEVVLATGTAPG